MREPRRETPSSSRAIQGPITNCYEYKERTDQLEDATSTTTILFIRHTDVHNPDDILYGRLPRFRLSDLGREQAARTAEALACERLGALYSSPRLRARQTAAIIAARHPGLRVRVTRLLDEVLTGWQGRPHSDLERFRFDFYSNRLNGKDESLEQLRARVEAFVKRATRTHRHETVAAVTHGDIAMLARAMYVGLPVEIGSLRTPNVYPGKGSVTRIRFNERQGETYPCSVDYFDPNAHGEAWSKGYVSLERGIGLKRGSEVAAV